MMYFVILYSIAKECRDTIADLFYEDSYLKEMLAIMDKAMELSQNECSDIENIHQLGEGWVAEEALAIAIYSCLKHLNSFEDTIVCAVNHDGDSDSTGSIAGNIIGAFLGEKAIPNYYLNNLELKEIISEIADDLSTTIPESEYSNNNEYWMSKYVRCHKS